MSEWIEVSAKTVEEAVTDALVKLETTSDNIEYEVIEKGTSGILGLGSKPAIIKVKKKDSVEDLIRTFLDNLFEKMNLNVNVDMEFNVEENAMYIELTGDDMGALIGKRGQTLDSIQYLTSLVVNKDRDDYLKIKLDTENYRERRKQTLENLARNMANKAKKFRKPVALEPMNPYERRIIHATLQDNPDVETNSEGEDPYRKVVIRVTKEFAATAPRRNFRRRNNNYGGRGGNRGGYRGGNKGGYRKNTYRKSYKSDYRSDYNNAGYRSNHEENSAE
ncbi:RNA-binding cell elongation regulator Jag/EloR [Eubacterium xylanophilum]|uniref:RNA-binding cell elongation regulator Jag/EloR n=1 Tax=Eubacterium xylanophilum TaxID=39497 RepID=UPI0004B02717|nr:RNA-binding cell elongation regulator Jag/EloR [Eubacterium xylanophilum]